MRIITSGTSVSIRTAIYLRVSTESQNYSTQHQRAAIAQYARDNAMEIVREYVDDGRSGLDIKRRAGLSRLISDVQAGNANFKAIIVYDVSRWGRFQDVDEAAYHEHTCRRAGISVGFCRVVDQPARFPWNGTAPLKLDGRFLPAQKIGRRTTLPRRRRLRTGLCGSCASARCRRERNRRTGTT
jgi:hypothetical protein